MLQLREMYVSILTNTIPPEMPNCAETHPLPSAKGYRQYYLNLKGSLKSLIQCGPDLYQ